MKTEIDRSFTSKLFSCSTSVERISNRQQQWAYKTTDITSRSQGEVFGQGSSRDFVRIGEPVPYELQVQYFAGDYVKEQTTFSFEQVDEFAPDVKNLLVDFDFQLSQQPRENVVAELLFYFAWTNELKTTDKLPIEWDDRWPENWFKFELNPVHGVKALANAIVLPFVKEKPYAAMILQQVAIFATGQLPEFSIKVSLALPSKIPNVGDWWNLVNVKTGGFLGLHVGVTTVTLEGTHSDEQSEETWELV